MADGDWADVMFHDLAVIRGAYVLVIGIVPYAHLIADGTESS